MLQRCGPRDKREEDKKKQRKLLTCTAYWYLGRYVCLLIISYARVIRVGEESSWSMKREKIYNDI